jgi:outer membrane lipoprotein-sorting protein
VCIDALEPATMIKPLALYFASLFAQPAPAPAAKVVKPPAAQVQIRVAAAPTAAEILSGVQKFYSGISGVNAKFRQEVLNTTFGRSDISDGYVRIQKPGKMRWEYYAKKQKGKATTVAKDFISNGKYLYVVDRDNKQVIKKDLQKNLLPTAITFLYGKGDLAKDFTPAIDTTGTYGAKGNLVLKLTPKSPSTQYKHLYLVVAPATFQVLESIIIDGANNKNHFRFFDSNFKAADKDATFELDEKSPALKNFRIVDGDAPQKATATTPAAPPPKATP